MLDSVRTQLSLGLNNFENVWLGKKPPWHQPGRLANLQRTACLKGVRTVLYYIVQYSTVNQIIDLIFMNKWKQNDNSSLNKINLLLYIIALLTAMNLPYQQPQVNILPQNFIFPPMCKFLKKVLGKNCQNLHKFWGKLSKFMHILEKIAKNLHNFE